MRGSRYATPPSGTRPRRTNTWMIFALSAAITRSAARTSIEPPPAAVPFNATMTGFSQSCIACMSCWNPPRIMFIAPPTTRSGASLGLSVRIGCGTERSAPVQKCFSPAAVNTTARTLRFACASRNALVSASRRYHGIALPLSARLMVSHSTPFSTRVCRSSPSNSSGVLTSSPPARRARPRPWTGPPTGSHPAP